MSYDAGQPTAYDRKPAPLEPSARAGGLQFLRAYNYIFENPQWTTTILWAFLAFLLSGMIPAVGFVAVLMMMGYQFEVIDALLVTKGARYPTFDSNRLGDYFTRGVWPFLALLITMIPVMFLFVFAYFVGIFSVILAVAAAGEELAAIAAVTVLLLVMFIVFLLMIAIGLVTVPICLRAGLSQDFAESFRIAWIRDFIRKMWLEILLSNLFLALCSLVLFPFGCAACFIGIYAVQALIFMAYTHLQYQMYALYLERGGLPVPVKPRAPQPPVVTPRPM